MDLTAEQEAQAVRLSTDLDLDLPVAREVIATGSGSGGCLPVDG
jgi:hypothetical protein